MKAYVISNPGGPEVLELKEIDEPIPSSGQALIAIKAFGLNRAEVVTRMGGSGDAVPFPRVIGIECVGVVEACPGGELQEGQIVAAAMGGMGRNYDGSYAEKTVVPINNVFPISTTLDWIRLAAVPETYFTAWGCCFKALKLGNANKPKVVVRPGASALGLAITQIINHLGGEVIGITRSAGKVDKLLAAGMKKVIVSRDTVVDQIKDIWPEGVDGVVDTVVSESSVQDDLAMLSSIGRICLAGSLADSYKTSPSADFKTALNDPRVDFYSSEELTTEIDTPKLQDIIKKVEDGSYGSITDKVFNFNDLQQAHIEMDSNAFAGKVVIEVNVN